MKRSQAGGDKNGRKDRVMIRLQNEEQQIRMVPVEQIEK